MYWQWNSRKGNERQSNNDAVGLINGKTFFFALLVDAVEKSDKSNEFACYWAETIASSVLSMGTYPSTDDLLNIMRNTQKQLRHQFLHETASYIALIYNKDTQKSQVLVCGDCRLGFILGDIKWLTKTHTLLTAFDDSLGDVKREVMTRHTLTHSLNAKRFIQPEVIAVDAPQDRQWILCSDGYWAEHIEEKTLWEGLKDDASCLTISMKELPSQLSSSDCKNCFSYELECDE